VLRSALLTYCIELDIFSSGLRIWHQMKPNVQQI
jgi:hypothetical protein